MSDREESEWEDIGKGPLIDDLYYTLRHKPCGKVVYVASGTTAYCPKCEPEEFEEQRKFYQRREA